MGLLATIKQAWPLSFLIFGVFCVILSILKEDDIYFYAGVLAYALGILGHLVGRGGK